MNAIDVLKFGHITLIHTITGLSSDQWELSGVCGRWSVKNIFAHLASHEFLMADILTSLLGSDGTTPHLDKFLKIGLAYNDVEVDARQAKSVADTIAEYNDAQAQVMILISQIPQATLQKKGALAWYGEQYDLEDYIVYGMYGHKREHSAEIAAFRDRLKLS